MIQSKIPFLSVVGALVGFAIYVVSIGTPGTAATAGLSVLLAALLIWAMRTADNANLIDANVARAGYENRLVEFGRSQAAFILNGVPDPAIILGSESQVILVNKAAKNLIQAESGMPITSIIRAPALLSAIERCLQSDVPTSTEFDHPVGRTLRAFVTPIDYGASTQRVTQALVVLHDKSAEEQLAQMRADFVANASHELRTPLASLKGFIETLQGAAKDDASARETFLPIMLNQAGRMSRLIDDLLSLSRVELREYLPPQGRVDLAEIANSAVQMMEPVAASEGRRMVLHKSAAPLAVTGDRDELIQVLQNLIQNAIKYGKPGGLVEVAASANDGMAAMSVRDDGIGISQEHLPRLTERFYRVNAKESRERGGTGLGLAIVKHIVNRHGGTLRISSELGKGSEFRVAIPLTRTT